MVQVIENWAELDGRLLAMQDDESRPGHKRVSLEVRAVRPVAPYPNLLQEAAGKTIEVILPDDVARSLELGSDLRCRARKSGPMTVYAASCSRIER
jgi:hypothetical protein